MSQLTDNHKFTIQAYSKSEMCSMYGVSSATWRSWLKPFLDEIGKYTGKRYTPDQVEKIVKKLSLPKNYV